jgi:hypothetical protein
MEDKLFCTETSVTSYFHLKLYLQYFSSIKLLTPVVIWFSIVFFIYNLVLLFI